MRVQNVFGKGLGFPLRKGKIKPFEISLTIRSVDEAKMLLLMFENSPTVFGTIINDIYEELERQGYNL